MLRLRAMEVLPLKGLPLLIASALLLDAPRAVPQSLDVALGGYGLSFGNSKRFCPSYGDTESNAALIPTAEPQFQFRRRGPLLG